MRKRTAIVGLIVVIAVFFILAQVEWNSHNQNPFGSKTFTVESGQGVRTIAANLKSQGFLAHPFWFEAYILFHGERAKLFAGEFKLKTDMTIKELADSLTSVKNANAEVDITIPEGWTVMDIDKYLATQNLIKPGELIDYSKKYNGFDYPFLIPRPSSATLEGYLYPDTYKVYAQTTVDKIAARMLNNFGSQLTPDLRQEIQRQNKSIFEVVTLASIVEKEISGYENRRVVADIFLKRLQAGMALQSDATVNYITKKNVASPSIADTKIDSAYNTYKYRGLPPGPICNPSIEAIKAVIYPTKTDAWYFLTTPDGTAYFSKTYDEHLSKKYKYLK